MYCGDVRKGEAQIRIPLYGHGQATGGPHGGRQKRRLVFLAFAPAFS